MAIQKLTVAALADNTITDSVIADDSIDIEKLSNVNLNIAPEILEIQVDAPDAGQDTMWKWTWEQSTLPYARRTITNSPEVNVPLYKQGTYTVNNFAAYDIHGSMTQTHSLYLKWINGAGTDNLVSWATSAGPISDTHPDINGGNATDVQRISVNVPSTITPPSLTNPSVAYTIANSGSGSYTFSGAAKGDNPNLGPVYRGGTYTFNVSATGHPFYLTTDNGTNFAAGTYFGEYTSGVTGSRNDSGTVTFTVPANAPDTLYYQCGNHSTMRGEITIKDLAVETNINGNYVVYFQHTQEGHKTAVELRPIPSLVNQMCIVYDASSGQFVPQDLSTYVENTPSFENKIREVAGTAELVVEDGSAVIAKVNVYDDSTYLPLTGNNAGDQAFATDTDILYIWDGTAWQQAGAANSDDLTEGSTNLFFTNARADARIALQAGSNLDLSGKSTTDLAEGTNLYYTDARVGTYLSGNDYDTATNIVASITDSAPATLDTLNELAAALGDDPNFATTTATNIAGKVAKTGDTMSGALTVGNTGGGANRGVGIDPNGEITQNATDGSWLHLNRYIDGLVAIGHNSTANFYAKNNVGIGTDNPQAKLHVTSSVLIEGGSTDSRTLGFTNASGSTGWSIGNGIIDSTHNFRIYDNTAGAARVTVDGNGNVGIGTTDPQASLHVSGDIRSDQASGKIGFGSGAASNWYSYMQYANDGSQNVGLEFFTTTNAGVANINHLHMHPDNGTIFNEASADLDFRVKSTGISSMLLVDAGEDVVKIGTTAGVQTAGNGDARLIVGNGIEIIQDLAANSLNKDMLRLSTAGSWSIPGNSGYYSDITWDNGGTNTMGRIGLRYSGTTTGGQSEFTIRDMYQGGFGNSGDIAHFGSNKSVIFEGSLKVGKTSADDTIGGINFEASTNAEAFAFTHTHASNNSGWSMLVNRQSSVGDAIRFRQANGDRGSISVGTSGTTYNTTSDRRLKDNITTITNGKEKLLAMNPVTHTWKADPNGDAVHGFIAQEMQEVIPEAVSGDAESDEMMSMDYGRITPVIVAALQDALNEIKELKTRIDELENK